MMPYQYNKNDAIVMLLSMFAYRRHCLKYATTVNAYDCKKKHFFRKTEALFYFQSSSDIIHAGKFTHIFTSHCIVENSSRFLVCSI